MSIASRIRGIRYAMTADELAEMLHMSRITILRRAKRGKIPSFRIGYGRLQGCSADMNPSLEMARAGLEHHTRLMAVGSHPGQHIGRGDPGRGEYSRRCDTRRRGEDRRQSPQGCVRAGSAIPIPAPTDQHPTLVRLGKAFVWSHEASE
jgi:hypothetical protein